MGTERLLIIRASLWNPEISLKEVGDLWLETKEIISNADYLLDSDVEISVKIFNKSREIVDCFWQKWLDKKIQPTDEEINLLENAFNEASWAFEFLATNYPSIFPLKDNEVSQKKIQENKQIIASERERRKNLNQPSQPSQPSQSSGFYAFLKENRVSFFFFFFCSNGWLVNSVFD